MTKPCGSRGNAIGMLRASDFEVEHEIYREDAVLNYPQSGERIRGRRNVQESRFVQPNKKRMLACASCEWASNEPCLREYCSRFDADRLKGPVSGWLLGPGPILVTQPGPHRAGVDLQNRCSQLTLDLAARTFSARGVRKAQ
jgi:hypothetical protein